VGGEGVEVPSVHELGIPFKYPNRYLKSESGSAKGVEDASCCELKQVWNCRLEFGWKHKESSEFRDKTFKRVARVERGLDADRLSTCRERCSVNLSDTYVQRSARIQLEECFN
jgi:hypothetical protein